MAKDFSAVFGKKTAQEEEDRRRAEEAKKKAEEEAGKKAEKTYSEPKQAVSSAGTKQGLNDSMAKRLGAEKGLELIEKNKQKKAAKAAFDASFMKEKQEAAKTKNKPEPMSGEEIYRLLSLDEGKTQKRIDELKAGRRNFGTTAQAVAAGRNAKSPVTGKAIGYDEERENEIRNLERDILLHGQLRKEYEFLGIQSDPTKMEAGAKGYESWLLGKEAAKAREQEERAGQSGFEEHVLNSWNNPDMSLPSGGFAAAVNAYREDTSENEPSDQWTEEQKRIFGYFYSIGNYAKAAEYARNINNANRSAENQKIIDGFKAWAMKNGGTKFVSDLGSVVTAGLDGIGYLDALAQQAAQGYITESAIPLPGDIRNAYRSERTEELNERFGTLGDSDIGLGTGYSVMMSSLDSMFAAFTGGKTGALINAFGGSASAALDDALERGATSEQALGYATLVGGAELLPEYMSVDSLFRLMDAKDAWTLIGNIGKQAGTEGLEGFITALSAKGVDDVIMGEISNFNVAVNELMLAGYSREEAEYLARKDEGSGIIFDTIAEALGGGFSGGVVTGINTAAGGNKTEVPVPFEGNARPGTEQGMVADKIAEIENRPISDAEKAAKMEKVAAAVLETTGNPEVIAEAEKFKNIHEERASVPETQQNPGETVAETQQGLFGPEIIGKILGLELESKGVFDSSVGTKNNLATQKDIDDYIEYAIEYRQRAKTEPVENIPKQNASIKYGLVSEKLANDLKKQYRMNFEGYFHELNDNDVRHIINSHGPDTNEKYPITAEDLKQIPDIVENYDNVYVVSKENGAQGIYYEKRHNGTTYYLEAIKGKQTLSNKQMIKVGTGDIPDIKGLSDEIKKRRIYSAPDDIKSPGYTSDNAWNNNSSNTIISPVSDKFNPPSIGNSVFGPEIVKEILGFGEETKSGKPIEHGEYEKVSAEAEQSARNVLKLLSERPKAQSTTGQVKTQAFESNEPEVSVPQTEKSRRFERRYQRNVEDGVASVFGVSRSDLRGNIRPIIEEITADLKDGKKVSDSRLDALYKAAFDDGIITEEFPQYQDTRKYIRTTPIYVDEKTRHEFGDDYAFRDFARSNFGSIKISSDPRSRHLDEFYGELSGIAPEFFNEAETDPRAQLEDIADFMQQTKKQYYGLSEVYSGSDLSDFESWAKAELRNYLDDFKKGIDIVSRYERDRQIKATNKARSMNAETSFDEAKAAFANSKVFDAKRAMERAKANEALSEDDLDTVKRLLSGTMNEADVRFKGAGNVDGIIKVYEAEKAYKAARAPFDRYKAAYKNALLHEAIEVTENSDEWKDKKIGAFYSRETAERNILDITKNGRLGGEKVLEEYFRPVHENEAMKIRWISELNSRVRALELGRMNKWERAYAQMIGENAEYISEGRITKHNEAEHAMLNEKIDNILHEHGNRIDKAKCEKAAAGLLEIYKDIHEQWNDERIRRGQEPVGYVENYFPHFTEAKPETVLQKIFAALGFGIGSSKLPTDIAGRTADRKPNTKYNPFANRRTSDTTDYDIFKGFDRYIRAAGDNIFHTEDIQKLRALSDTIRTKYSSVELEKRIEEIRNDKEHSEQDKEVLISDAIKNAGNMYHLSNFVVWLDEYTNILAGKKNRGDRDMEYQMGRESYDISKALEGRIAANMIGYNASTPIMNLVPLFQATADISPANIISSLAQTGIAALKGDSYISDNSDFIINRMGADSVYRRNYNLFTAENMKDAVAKIQDGGAFAMELTDRIVSDTLIRARVAQNMRDRGMSTEEAFSEADQWAAGLIADRSLGALPTVFNVKNPIVKAFTMFQVEANNQYSYIFKDAGKYKWDKKGAVDTITGQLAFWTAMAICKGLAKELLGRDNVVPDPVGITAETVAKLQKGEQVGDVLLDTATSVVEQIPFIGGIMGGGRVPLSAALPDMEQVFKLFNKEVLWEKKKDILVNDVARPLSYILAPSGAGQIWKTVQGAQQIAAGGAYGTEADGTEYLKFLQGKELEDFYKTLLFGRYASDAGQEYIDSGFSTSLSAKQTQQMKMAEYFGVPNEEFYSAMMELRGYSTKSEKQEALFALDISENAKNVIDGILWGGMTYKDENPQSTRNYSSVEAFYTSGLMAKDFRLHELGYSESEIAEINKALKKSGTKAGQLENLGKVLGTSEAETFEVYQRMNGDWIENAEDLSEEESARASGAEGFYGMSTENYLAVLNAKGFGGDSKAEIIESLMNLNAWDAKTAEENYNRVFVYEYSREDISEEQAEGLETAQSRYGVDDFGYFVARNAIKTAEGEKDKYGNTVSGSKKAAAIKAIAKELGIDESEATVYYLAANGDLALSASDLSSAKQADLEEAMKYGWTEIEFLNAVNIVKLAGATKKADIIEALVAAGATYEMAYGYYNLQQNNDYYKR